MSADVTVVVSLEQLAALAVALELPMPRLLDGTGIIELSEDARILVMDVAARALVAQDLLERDGDRLMPPSWLAAVMTVVSRPALVVESIIDEGDGPSRVLTGATPDLAVEQTILSNGSCRLDAYQPEDLLARIVASSMLVDRPVAASGEVCATVAAFGDADALLMAGDVAGAVEALVDGGADEESAAAYVDATLCRRHASQVTVVHRVGDGAIHGCAITWVDCGDSGLWELPIVAIDPIDPETMRAARVTVAPRSAGELLDEIRAGLPDV